ncbi:ABC transporter ATP-binding protein [Leucobacter weissii]|uniref:ABC transporter ATP-binding protein n=1 Tax=Leucobacter weissii TaxID=1983706 RepID=A0A939MMX8_9MICO|nr:ABC transporter ATP-binding protein [Leucobacter weissii]MBO1901537.1 ABC transporter ATP-binding protein [Leucobacter weissii]
MSILEVGDLRAYYGPVEAVHGIDFRLAEGEIVALLGANGAGKTTTMRAVSRMIRTTGEIIWEGQSITRLSTHRVAALGVGHIPDGRGTFVGLTVEENLGLGVLARGRRDRDRSDDDLADIYRRFPVLDEMRGRIAGALSGGQQQILAIARALLGRPRLLMFDELSLGLAPQITSEIFSRLAELREEWDLTMLVAEQNVRQSLAVADRAYVLDSGAIVAEGTPEELGQGDVVERAYLGQ